VPPCPCPMPPWKKLAGDRTRAVDKVVIILPPSLPSPLNSTPSHLRPCPARSKKIGSVRQGKRGKGRVCVGVYVIVEEREGEYVYFLKKTLTMHDTADACTHTPTLSCICDIEFSEMHVRKAFDFFFAK